MVPVVAPSDRRCPFCGLYRHFGNGLSAFFVACSDGAGHGTERLFLPIRGDTFMTSALPARVSGHEIAEMDGFGAKC